MLTVRFIFQDKIITWYIAPYLSQAFFFFFCSMLGSGLYYFVIQRPKRLNHEKEITKVPKGGVDLERVLEPDRVYEIVDQTLAARIREMLKEAVIPLIVDQRVVIIAQTLIKKHLFLINLPILGVSVTNPIGNMVIPVMTGFLGTPLMQFWLSPVLMTALGLNSLNAFLLGVCLLGGTFYGAQTINNLINDRPSVVKRVIRELPAKEILSLPSGNENNEKKDIGYFATPDSPSEPIEDRIYVRTADGEKFDVSGTGSLELEGDIYIPISNEKEPNCIQRKEGNRVQETCPPTKKTYQSYKDKYGSLKSRTKTTDDILRGNDGETLADSQEALEIYQKKADQFAKKRMQIKQRTGRLNPKKPSLDPIEDCSIE